MTLAELDCIIQAAMGWTNSHMHLFAIDGNLYGLPDDERIDDKPVLPDGEFTLDEVLGTSVQGFLHEYNLSEGWHHEVTV